MSGTTSKFTAENFDLLNQGIRNLLDGLSEAVSMDPEATAKDVIRKLPKEDRQTWDRINEIFNDSSLYEPYTVDKNTEPVQALVCLYRSMDECKTELLNKLKVFEQRETKLNVQIDDLKDQVVTLKSELENAHHRLRVESSIVKSKDNEISLLNQQKAEKDRIMHDLQRSSNVTIWEKEKERAFENHLAKQRELERKLEEREKEMRMKCEKYEQQLEEMQNSSKLQKIGDEMKDRKASVSQETAELKRQVFYLAKDLLTSEKEVFKYQQQICGILQGVERDFRIVHHKMVDNKEVTMWHLNKLADWLSTLLSAFQEGDMSKRLVEMPDYYRDIDLKKLKPYKVKRSINTKEEGTNTKLEEVVKNLEKEVYEIETSRAIEKVEAAYGSTLKKSRGDHPELIHGNGKVNTTALIKHFPALSVPFVQEQWRNFKAYDKNGDGHLDLSEVMTAITSTLGHKFTASQVVEAMSEVDDDDTATLDFYEYLKVSLLIMQKSGNASMLRAEEVIKNKKELSKTCLIQ